MVMVVIMRWRRRWRWVHADDEDGDGGNLTASLLQRSLLVLVVELLHNHVHPRARSQLLRQADDGDDLQNMLGRKFIQMDDGDGDAVWCSVVMLPLLFIHISLLNHQ